MSTSPTARRRVAGIAVASLLALVGLSGPALAHPGKVHVAVSASPLLRSTAQYRLPDEAVPLVRADGKRVALADELAFDGPIVLNFVFTTCSAVCPIASRTFSELQGKLVGGQRVRLMSISLDPLNDTPQALRAYASKFGAGPDWHFYTGSVDASVAAQRAFDLFRGDKMNHVPVTMVRPNRDGAWVRLEGFPSADQLAAELKRPAPVVGSSKKLARE